MKIAKKVLLWIVVVLVAIIAIGMIGVTLFFPTGQVRDWIVDYGKSELDRAIAIDKLSVSFWGGPGIVLEQVVVSSLEHPSDTLLRSDRIDLKLKLWPLLFGDYAVDRLVIVSPDIRLRKVDETTSNYSFEKVADAAITAGIVDSTVSEEAVGFGLIAIDNLEIRNGLLSFVDETTNNGLRWVGLSLQSELTQKRDFLFEFTGLLLADSVTIKNDVDYGPYAVTLEATGEYDNSSDRLSVAGGELLINGLPLSLNGEARPLMAEPRWRMSLAASGLSPDKLTSLLDSERRALLSDYTIDGLVRVDAELYGSPDDSTMRYAATVELTNLNMSSKQIPGQLACRRLLLDLKPDNLRGMIEQGQFDGRPLRGHVVVENFSDPVVTGEMAGSLDLSYVAPFLPGKAVERLSGRSDFDMKFFGRPADFEAFRFTGSLAIDSGSVEAPFLPTPIDSFTVVAQFGNRTVNVEALRMVLPDGDASFSGRISDLLPFVLADSATADLISPGIDGRLTGSAPLSLLQPYLSKEGAPSVDGRLNLDLQLAGRIQSMASFRPRGTIDISGASYSDSLLPESITNMEASLSILPDTIFVRKLSVALESSDFALTGKMLYPFPYFLPITSEERSRVRKPMFFFELSSHVFDFDKLFPEAVPGAQEDSVLTPPDDLSPIILPDVDGRGSFVADSVVYARVEFSDVTGKVTVQDRRIDLYDVQGKMYGGNVSGKTTIDLSDLTLPLYQGEFQAEGVEADGFISTFTNFGGYLFGKLKIRGYYDATGWNKAAFLESLSMNGTAAVNDGELATSGQIATALTTLATQAGKTYQPKQAIQNLTSEYLIKDGRVRFDKLLATFGDVGDFDVNGSYGFDGSIDYAGSVKISEAWTSGLLQKLGGQNLLGSIVGPSSVKRVSLPLKLDGNVEAPRLKFDLEGIGSSLGGSLKEKAGGVLDMFKKKPDSGQ
jgi:hypothetical protein